MRKAGSNMLNGNNEAGIVSPDDIVLKFMLYTK